MKIVLTSILLTFALNSVSQQVSPLQVSGSGWRYTGWFLDGNFPYIEDVYTFTFDGDTTVNSKVFSKYYYSLVRHWGFNPGITIIDNMYTGCLRSDENKVYYISKDSTTEILLYDYSLSIGDTVPSGLLPDSTHLIITDTSTIQMEDGSLRKQYILNNWNPHSIIYGIGYQTGLLPAFSFIDTVYDGGTHFVTYCENGIRVYHFQVGGFLHADNCDFPLSSETHKINHPLRAYPNPCNTGKLLVKASDEWNSINSIQVINTQGFIIKELNFNTSDGGEIDISGLNQGYYILRVLFQDGSYQHIKILIEYPE